ncbi:MAG: methylenetetrahydrofolate reductase, partial [Cyanobacteria bacterium P01_D01_bin.44]
TSIIELPKTIQEVSITFLPGTDYQDVIAQAIQLRKQGFEPIPHIPARSLRSRLDLSDFMMRLRHEACIRQVLLIGGSPTEPMGPYASTLDLLDTGLFEGLRIGVAGHPEGTPQLSGDQSDQILALKNAYARDTGTEMFVVTQWSLDVDAIATWLDRIEAFNTLPIYLGIPGPTTPASLLKFARICGVKASLIGLRHQSARLGQLITVQTPDYLIDALQNRVDHFHLYTFGGIKRTREWLIDRRAKVLLQM